MFSKGKTVSKIVENISPFAAAVSIPVPFKVVICKAPFRLWKFANFLGKSRVSSFTRVGWFSGLEDHCGQFEKTIALKLLPCHLQGNVPIKKVRDVPCSGSVSLPVHYVKLSVAGHFLDVQNFHCRSHRTGSFKVFSFLRSQRTKPFRGPGRSVWSAWCYFIQRQV